MLRCTLTSARILTQFEVDQKSLKRIVKAAKNVKVFGDVVTKSATQIPPPSYHAEKEEEEFAPNPSYWD